MAEVMIKCECGNSLMATVSDNIYNEKLVWHMSYRCEKCGAVIEMDDTDYMPDEIRQAIINDEGKY